jgi:hypothetical protein
VYFNNTIHHLFSFFLAPFTDTWDVLPVIYTFNHTREIEQKTCTHLFFLIFHQLFPNIILFSTKNDIALIAVVINYLYIFNILEVNQVLDYDVSDLSRARSFLLA